MHPDYTSKDVQRFWTKVAITANPDKCWDWQAGKNPFGYGSFRLKKMRSAHRAAWEITYGIIPDGLFVLHKCDNPTCVNLNHLFLGTNQDNVNDMIAKGRARNIGETHWQHKLTSLQILDIRKCIEERRISQREIAKQMGVSESTISLIVSRKTWKSI